MIVDNILFSGWRPAISMEFLVLLVKLCFKVYVRSKNNIMVKIIIYTIRIDTGLGLLFHKDNYARSYLLDKLGK